MVVFARSPSSKVSVGEIGTEGWDDDGLLPAHSSRLRPGKTLWFFQFHPHQYDYFAGEIP